jgi:hypothetical protein
MHHKTFPKLPVAGVSQQAAVTLEKFCLQFIHAIEHLNHKITSPSPEIAI